MCQYFSLTLQRKGKVQSLCIQDFPYYIYKV